MRRRSAAADRLETLHLADDDTLNVVGDRVIVDLDLDERADQRVMTECGHSRTNRLTSMVPSAAAPEMANHGWRRPASQRPRSGSAVTVRRSTQGRSDRT